MVVIHCAYTEPINPAGASPILTRDEIWRGLQRKIRRAQDFVPVIEGCDVLEEREGDVAAGEGDKVVVREAHFRAQDGQPAHSVREVCRSYYPTKVDFIQPNGAVITNTVSDGSGLTENDLHMTYTFEWRHPEVEEGSDEAKELAQTKVKMAKMAVHSSILALRKMAAAGELN